MHDRLIDEEVRYINGTTYYVATFAITELPDGCKIGLDAIYAILEKARKRWEIRDENALFNFCRNVDKDSKQATYTYALLIPLKKAIQIRRKERFESWQKGKTIVTPEEDELFSKIQEALNQGKKLKIDELSIFYGSKNAFPSPLEMPGLPKED